jgi:hypothetical protein
MKYAHSYFDYSTRALDSDLIAWIGHNMNKLENDLEHGRVKVLNE